MSCLTTRKGEDELVAPTPASNPSTPNTEAIQQRASQQRIEDRIHSFTDALMAEIRKHKAWKNVSEEVLRSGSGEEN